MRTRSVVFAPEARQDLLRIYDTVADTASPLVAIAYVESWKLTATDLILRPSAVDGGTIYVRGCASPASNAVSRSLLRWLTVK